jgi:hypothetical protein
MSICAHSTPFSTKLYIDLSITSRKAAACADPPTGLPDALVKSAVFGLTNSRCYSSIGICHMCYLVWFAASFSVSISSLLLENNPAADWPNATIMAPVSVDNSISCLGL